MYLAMDKTFPYLRIGVVSRLRVTSLFGAATMLNVNKIMFRTLFHALIIQSNEIPIYIINISQRMKLSKPLNQSIM
jgi:hypothetical protein